MPFGELRAGILAGVVGFAVACGGSVIGPENQLEVANLTDNFQLQATALADVSETLTYTWENTGTGANVNQSGTVTGGSATLTIEDDAGTEVYRASLAETGTFQTSAGIAGAWTVRVELSGMSGTLNFRVQKP
jgi:hypothetical protein